jgi:Replication initiator protein, pSAM2
MTSPALAQAPVLVDDHPRPGARTRTLNAELLGRATRDDYQQWLSTALAAGGCVRPIRLRDIDPATGEVIRGLDTGDLPDKAIYLPCGDRRASVCPPCAETYRADTYQLIRAGLAGGKGVPESVATHPCVFATFTAPSFGAVHTLWQRPEARGPAAAHGARRATAPTDGACRAGSGTGNPTPAWAGRCAQIATTTRLPSCGTPTPPSCGGAPSSPSAAASTSWPRPTVYGSSCPTPRSASSSAAG